MNKKTTLIAAAISAAISLPALASDSMRLIVEYKPGQGAAVKTALEQKGIKVHRELKDFDSIALSVSKEQFAELKSVDGISMVYPDAKRKLQGNAVGEISPYGIAMTQADQLNYAGGTKVCIIDSGYDYGHPDLPAANVTGEMGLSGPWNEDDHSHGTHVAGTIAAVGDNGEGVVGVNSDENMNLHIVRVFNAAGNFAYASSLVGAVSDCVDADADIISMSLGGSFENPIERKAMDAAAREGVLIIAAAGNDGNATHSYPASYDSVMSVAAIDSAAQHANFSQRTSQVEIAGPGVNTLSTVPRGMGQSGVGVVSQESNAYEAIPMQGSTIGSIDAPLADCGVGTSACEDVAGKICLIERGEIAFGAKVANCEAGGGVGAIVYNNVPGTLSGTLGGDSALVAVGISQADGQELMSNIGMETSINIEQLANYDYMSGTSMATPHVSGVAALVWSHFPQCSGNDIRMALRASASDLAEAGYDYNTGWGLIQAKDAYDYLATNGCKSSNGKIHGGDGSAR